MDAVLDQRLRVTEVMVAGFAVAFGIAAMRIPGYMSSCDVIGSFHPHRGWMNILRFSSVACAVVSIGLAVWRSRRLVGEGNGDISDLWLNLAAGLAVGVAVAAVLAMGAAGCID
jgi:hypothetical protein